MNANIITPSYVNLIRFFESIVRYLKSKDSMETEQTGERCMCGVCLDPLSRSHSDSVRQFREHDRVLVQQWLHKSAYDNQADAKVDYVPREIQLEGFAEAYLEKLEDGWWQAEKR